MAALARVPLRGRSGELAFAAFFNVVIGMKPSRRIFPTLTPGRASHSVRAVRDIASYLQNNPARTE
jgi:hypothetical protein